MTRTLRVLAIALLLGGLIGASQAASLAGTPLAARLTWEEAVAVGDLTLSGGIVGLHVPIDTSRDPPTAAVFVLDADRVEVLQESRDYVYTGASSVSSDTDWRVVQDTLAPARLRLDSVRHQVMTLLGKPGDADAPSSAVVRIPTSEALVAGVGQVSQTFFPQRLVGDGSFQRTVRHEGPAVSFVTDAPDESLVIEGDFILYLWDLDVKDADSGRIFQSGEIYSNQKAPTDQNPEGAVADKRKQMLTLTVHGGRLTFALPGRPVTAFAEPATASLATSGSWDLTGATGSVSLAGLSSQVDSTDVHLAGEFTTSFTESFPLSGAWGGTAVEATAAREVLPVGVVPTRDSSSFAWWPWLLGIGLLGAGGASVLGIRAARSRVARPEAVATAGEVIDESDDLVTEAIALMEQGRAHEVIESLEPGFDAADASAPVRAYLLSLAHLREGRTEPGIVWILRAVEYFPEFVQELQFNAAFAPVREDPRIQRILNRQGVAGYV